MVNYVSRKFSKLLFIVVIVIILRKYFDIKIKYLFILRVEKLKVLVFGSGGLVGTSLSKILSKSKKVSNLVLSTRNDTDLLDFSETKNKILDLKPDLLINAAAKVGGIVANNSYRTSFILENMKINMNILESSIPLTNTRIINLGSSCIYPLNAENPIKESTIMTGKLEPTNSPYSMAKLSAIEIGRAINYEYGNKIINLMPTNLYGPNDNFSKENSHVIPGLISRMHSDMENKIDNFLIWGSGKPLREFLFVDDLSMAIEFLIDKDIDTDLLNIGSGEEISILDLAIKVKETIGYEGSIEFDASKPDGNPRKLIDSTIIKDFGWKPITNLDSGLKTTYEWYLKNFDKIRN